METIEREITLTKQRSVSLKKGLSKLKSRNCLET